MPLPVLSSHTGHSGRQALRGQTGLGVLQGTRLVRRPSWGAGPRVRGDHVPHFMWFQSYWASNTALSAGVQEVCGRQERTQVSYLDEGGLRLSLPEPLSRAPTTCAAGSSHILREMQGIRNARVLNGQWIQC